MRDRERELTTSPLSCAVGLEILGTWTFWSPKGLSNPVKRYFWYQVKAKNPAPIFSADPATRAAMLSVWMRRSVETSNHQVATCVGTWHSASEVFCLDKKLCKVNTDITDNCCIFTENVSGKKTEEGLARPPSSLLLFVGLPVANAPDVLQPCGLLYYP